MNNYTKQLHKEISAQLGGAIPSKIWGRIVDPVKDKHDRSVYRSLHATDDPGSKFIKGTRSKNIRSIAKDFKKSQNSSGIIKTSSIKHD